MKPRRGLLLAAALVCCGTPAAEGFTNGGFVAGWQLPGDVPARRLAGFQSLRTVNALKMAVTDADTWKRPEPRGKRDITFGTRISSSYPVAPKHDEGCNLVCVLLSSLRPLHLHSAFSHLEQHCADRHHLTAIPVVFTVYSGSVL